MKQWKWRKLAAVFLVVCLSAGMVTPAGALGRYSTGSTASRWSSLTDRWNNLWDSIFGGAQEEEPAEDAGNAETESGDLTLVEDETTVTEGTDLRASTYNLQLMAGGEEDLKYFPVTLYNYDTTGANNATHQLEVDNGLKTKWEGIYFSKGNPGHEESGVEKDISKTYSYTDPNGDDEYHEASVYYSRNSSYSTYTRGNHYYWNGSNYVAVNRLSCSWSLWNGYTWTINNQYEATDNPLTLYTKTTSSQNNVTKEYADWNFWTGNLSGATGNYIYSGIVQSQLSADKSIVFNHLEPGLFTSDQANWKDIYYNVGLPFKYDSATLSYTFDSSQMAAHFTDGAASNKNLTYGTTPQSNGTDYADGSKTVWMPFNSEVAIDGEENCDYHFGMQATIPFTMTTDGLISSTNKTPITFDFSGDDDVWVFIDGKLVLDLGGIHNSMGGSLNFADNTWKITIGEGNTKTDVDVGDAAGNYTATSSTGYWGTKDTISGQLFNDDDGQGVLNMTRETFAATEEHTLTIYYLERGGGSSNCKIKFNLPMKDQVTVQKQVSNVDSEGMQLDPTTLAALNNRTYTFVLYHGNEPVTNATYLLYDTDGSYLQSPSTTSSGQFTLKNGQTAKFISEISADGSSYHVVETTPGMDWVAPTWTQETVAANGSSGSETSDGLTSMTVTAKGSPEAVDTIAFVCKNTVQHQAETNLEVNPDSIVIDYGLPVQIAVLDNDVPYGGTLSVTDVTEGQYGTAIIVNNKIVYTLTDQLTDVEILTYTAKLTASNGVESDNKTATGQIYIIPATTMYYEENFNGLVVFTGSWTPVNDSQYVSAYQEPGVVGTVGDSPYGSDIAYLDDSADSNGTSMYVSTASAVAQFSYTFTGTGTSFFARTTNNTGYMRVVVSKDNQTVYQLMRDTSYKTKNAETTLYNIPVFTYMAEEYGTYTVTVTLANAGIATGYGSDFWLDGIRVYNPIDMTSDLYSTATDAYAQDGEANMTNVTLREKLLADATIVGSDGSLVWDGVNFVIFTDTNDQIIYASEYQSNGPKEEVYLADGQSVTFSLKDWNVNSNKIYLGIKAPMGVGSVSINGHSVSINNTCDCYYDISDYVSLSDTTATFEIKASGAVISVTNIKVTGNAEFTIVGGNDVDVSGSGNVEMP